MTIGGRWFAVSSGLFFGYGTSSLELQAFVPLSYCAALWLCAFVALWFARPRVQLKIEHDGRVQAGESLPVAIEIIAPRGARESRISLIEAPPNLALDNALAHPLPALSRGEKWRDTLNLKAARRGRYELRGWRVETDFPLGLLNAWTNFPQSRALLAHPNWTPLETLHLTEQRRHQPGGAAQSNARGESFEFWGNRDFRDGDNPRDIDWRATARLQRTVAREFREEFFLRAGVLLDTFAPRQEDDFERAVSLCAALGDYLARADYRVDLLAVGPHLFHLAQARGPSGVEEMLDVLACVEADDAPPFELLEQEVAPQLAQMGALICVFLDWTIERQTLAARLAQSGATLKIIIARDAPCTLAPDSEITIMTGEVFARGVTDL